MNTSIRIRDKQIVSANGASKILMVRRRIEGSSCTDATSKVAEAKVLAGVYAFILKGTSCVPDDYKDGEAWNVP